MLRTDLTHYSTCPHCGKIRSITAFHGLQPPTWQLTIWVGGKAPLSCLCEPGIILPC